MKKTILDLCGGTGAWSKPYKENGYDVKVITLPDYDISQTIIRSGECFEFRGQAEPLKVNIADVYGILAAPPCTHFSNARRRAKEPLNLKGAMKTVDDCLLIVRECLYKNHIRNMGGLRFWALENPYSGYLKRFLGLPLHVFDPCDYGDPVTKKTALWGEFTQPKKNRVQPNQIGYSKTNKKDFATSAAHLADYSLIPEGYQEKTGYDKRKIARSITPQGFAKAFYEANK